MTVLVATVELYAPRDRPFQAQNAPLQHIEDVVTRLVNSEWRVSILGVSLISIPKAMTRFLTGPMSTVDIAWDPFPRLETTSRYIELGSLPSGLHAISSMKPWTA